MMGAQQVRAGQSEFSMGSPTALRRWLMLAMATVGFAVNFWAWALLSPLAPKLKDALQLSPFQQALLVAVPVVVGSLGRIPARPYVPYRSRDTRPGLRPTRPGWEGAPRLPGHTTSKPKKQARRG